MPWVYPWLKKNSFGLGYQEVSKTTLPPVFQERFCNHAEILAPSSIPGQEKKKDLRVQQFLKNQRMVWSYLSQAFEVKQTQEALQKLKEGNCKFNLVVQAMAVG